MKLHNLEASNLTKNQSLVFGALTTEEGPLTAYAILDRLKPDGLRAPPQIYRALEKLMALGLVHRLESLNSFMACQHPDCSSHAMSAFSICERCGDVQEYTDTQLDGVLASLAEHDGFRLKSSTIELRGCCNNCPPKHEDG